MRRALPCRRGTSTLLGRVGLERQSQHRALLRLGLEDRRVTGNMHRFTWSRPGQRTAFLNARALRRSAAGRRSGRRWPQRRGQLFQVDERRAELPTRWPARRRRPCRASSRATSRTSLSVASVIVASIVLSPSSASMNAARRRQRIPPTCRPARPCAASSSASSLSPRRVQTAKAEEGDAGERAYSGRQALRR